MVDLGVIDTDLEMRLISGKPIPFQQLFIHQLTLSEIIDMGWSNFDKICFPYILTKDYIGIPDDEKFSKITIFDLFFQKEFTTNNESVLKLFIASCEIFFKTNNINIEPDSSMRYFQVNIDEGKVVINRNNFSKFQDIIIETYKLRLLEKPVKEKKINNKRLADKMKKLLKGREESAKTKSNDICMIYNYVTLVQGYIDYKKVMELTVYQLVNTYLSLIKKESYQTGIQFRAAALAQGAELEEFPHWIIKE